MHDNENQFGSERKKSGRSSTWYSLGRAGNNKLICSQREFLPEGPFSPRLTAQTRPGGKFNARKGGGAVRGEESAGEPPMKTDSLTDPPTDDCVTDSVERS